MKKWKIRKRQLKKGILCMAIAGFMCSLYQTELYAEQEPDYSREITPEMQLEEQMNEKKDGEGSRITIADGVSYDTEAERYVYFVGNNLLYANVLPGMLTQDAVSISAEESATYAIYRENEALDLQNMQEITDAGTYTVMTGKEGDQKKLFSFQIIGADTNQPVNYELPDGCIATSLTFDEEEMLTNNRELSFAQEGHYTVDWECVRSGIQYRLEFNMDRTPPKLEFDGVKENKAHQAVTIQGLEERDTLVITKDGKEISASTRLTQPGEYELHVTDAAGNANVYVFYILFYLNAGSVTFVTVLLLAFVALGVYLYISRKKLRIR